MDQDEPVVETPPKRHEHGVDEIQVDSSSGVSSPKVGESLIFLNNLGNPNWMAGTKKESTESAF